MSWTRLVGLLGIGVAFVGAAWASTDTVPTCGSPQALGPPVLVNPSTTYNNATAWNGHDFGTLFYDQQTSSIRFERLYADGTSAASPVTVAAGAATIAMRLVWNGSGYGAVWFAPFNNTNQAYFARLNTGGGIVSGPTRVSFVNNPANAVNLNDGSLAWNGNGYAVAYTAYTNSSDVYATLLDANGVITHADVVITNAVNYQSQATVTWSPFALEYIVAWQDVANGTHYEIGTAQLFPSGTVSVNGSIVSGAGSSFVPNIVAGGNNLGLAWSDTRDGNYEIYYATLTPYGYKIGNELRVTTDGNFSYLPVLLWTGGEYGLFWEDTRISGNYDLWFQRISASGSLVGSNTPLTYGLGVNSYSMAFATHGYLALYDTGGAMSALPWGCSYPYVPGCPEAPDAYGISGTSATIAWLSAYDPYTDIAYYQVFRNDALVGTTSNTSFTDTGLSTNTTYQYNIRAMNAADLYSTPCPNSQIYVKSSAALALAVSKTATDIDLAWTDASGQNTYRVMRGTSPQVMTQIDQTSQQTAVDPNAAVGPVCYFYSIDVPQ